MVVVADSLKYRFALMGLWICSLMEVSVFNAGYMAIFIVFVIWQKLATRFWILLVLYCQIGADLSSEMLIMCINKI